MPGLRTVKHTRNQKGRWHILQSLFFIFIFSMAIYVFLQSSFFRVTDITVNGNKQLTKNEVLALTGVAKGINIFKANLKQAEDKVLLHPLIKQVHIKRSLPSTLIVDVIERKPTALLADKGGFVIVGDDGCYLKKVPNLSTINLPIITGIKPGNVPPGQNITGEGMNTALAYLLAMPANFRATVSEINVSDQNNIRLFTIDGIEVKLGDGTRIPEKMSLCQQVITQKYQNRILYIDISYKGRPVIKFTNT